jgi:hypothetical protein
MRWSAHGPRAVPEWRMRQVRSEINRYQGLIRANKMRQAKQAKNTPVSNGTPCFGLSESAICNFSR